ncbi:MAG TPA: cupredoxin domain-containing protein [Candidatus Nanoarchaeia archaeon]|nr:cupredoxin domain-containing protein [Candidatus Nanoarchaeia archaeon]
MQNLSYIAIYALSLSILTATAFYIHKLRSKLDEMHGMMVGMTLGMLAGLITSTLFLIPTGNFLWGVMIGSFVGLLFGIPFGHLGGHLGIMEGVVAGPMGGMMGAMLGQMVRPFSIEIFMPFFAFIFLITAIGISYTVHCKANFSEEEQKPAKIPKKFALIWAVVFLILLLTSIALPFSISQNTQTKSLQLPPALQNIVKEERAEAVVKGNYQEVDLRITSSRYSPNIIVAKKGIPLRINVNADENAGCASEIVFPDFNIDVIIPAGGSEVIDINPTEAGTFNFRCSMDMVHGKLIINK